MTSDFENDEIKDSAFPVDFTDDAESLDQYGVWVKSGPRDVPAESPATAPVQSEPEFPEIGEPGLGLSSDISELPPLPDLMNLKIRRPPKIRKSLVMKLNRSRPFRLSGKSMTCRICPISRVRSNSRR